MNRYASFTVVFAGILTLLGPAAADPIKAETWTDRHKNALAKLDTVYMELSTDQENENGKFHMEDGRYWRKGDSIRLFFPKTSKGYRSYFDWSKGKLTHISDHHSRNLVPPKDPNIITGHLHPPEIKMIDADPWEWSLFRVPLGMCMFEPPGYPVLSFPELIQKYKPLEVKTEKVNGSTVHHYTVFVPGKERLKGRLIRFRVSESRNSLVDLAEITYSQDEGKPAEKQEFSFRYEVKGWQEVSKGILVPGEIEKSWRFENTTATDKARITRIELGDKIPEIPPLPSFAGRSILDSERAETIVFDAAGREKERRKLRGEIVPK